MLVCRCLQWCGFPLLPHCPPFCCQSAQTCLICSVAWLTGRHMGCAGETVRHSRRTHNLQTCKLLRQELFSVQLGPPDTSGKRARDKLATAGKQFMANRNRYEGLCVVQPLSASGQLAGEADYLPTFSLASQEDRPLSSRVDFLLELAAGKVQQGMPNCSRPSCMQCSCGYCAQCPARTTHRLTNAGQPSSSLSVHVLQSHTHLCNAAAYEQTHSCDS